MEYGPSNHRTTALRCPWLTRTFLANAVTFIYLTRCRNHLLWCGTNTNGPSSYLILCWCWIYHLSSNWSSKDSKCSQSNYRALEESCIFSANEISLLLDSPKLIYSPQSGQRVPPQVGEGTAPHGFLGLVNVNIPQSQSLFACICSRIVVVSIKLWSDQRNHCWYNEKFYCSLCSFMDRLLLWDKLTLLAVNRKASLKWDLTQNQC